jgi:hypothetical protein
MISNNHIEGWALMLIRTIMRGTVVSLIDVLLLLLLALDGWERDIDEHTISFAFHNIQSARNLRSRFRNTEGFHGQRRTFDGCLVCQFSIILSTSIFYNSLTSGCAVDSLPSFTKKRSSSSTSESIQKLVAIRLLFGRSSRACRFPQKGNATPQDISGERGGDLHNMHHASRCF